MLSLYLSLSLYIYICICVCVYIYIYKWEVPQLGDTKYILGSTISFEPIEEIPRKTNRLASFSLYLSIYFLFFLSIYLHSIYIYIYICTGFQWEFLQVMFNPPVSMQMTVISVTVRAANDLMNRARIILKMPQITRVGGQSGAEYYVICYI